MFTGFWCGHAPFIAGMVKLPGSKNRAAEHPIGSTRFLDVRQAAQPVDQLLEPPATERYKTSSSLFETTVGSYSQRLGLFGGLDKRTASARQPRRGAGNAGKGKTLESPPIDHFSEFLRRAEQN